MRQPSPGDIRILAVAPSTRGFGFAVLEGPRSLIDWGVKPVRREKNSRCLAKIKQLTEDYQPQVIVLEDHISQGSRRHARIQDLIDNIGHLATKTGVRVKRLSRSNVRQAFGSENAQTKHEIALAIGRQFTELSSRVPPLRRPWMSAHYQTQMFEAVALALGYFWLVTNKPQNSQGNRVEVQD